MSRGSAFTRLRTERTAFAMAFSFALHVGTGFIAVAAHYGVMWALLHAGMRPVAASSAGFVGGAATRFALSYTGVFVPTRGVAAAGSRFVVAILLQLMLNSALLAALLSAGIDVWPAQVTATIGLTTINYIIYRAWVFR